MHSKSKTFLLFVLLIAILLSLLPIYPVVHEVRYSMLDGNHELGRELSFGSMVDFVQDFKYIKNAWAKSILPLNIFIAAINIALCFSISWGVNLFIHTLWKRLKNNNED